MSDRLSTRIDNKRPGDRWSHGFCRKHPRVSIDVRSLRVWVVDGARAGGNLGRGHRYLDRVPGGGVGRG